MTVRAVVVPASPLLVPGAAGRADVLPRTRSAALGALALLRADEGAVTVLAATAGATTSGRPVASLSAVGVRDDLLDPAWAVACGAGAGRASAGAGRAGPGASVALLALAAAAPGTVGDVTAGVDVVEVGPELAPGACVELGRDLRERGARLVVAEEPRSTALSAVLAAFLDPAWVEVRADPDELDDAGPRGPGRPWGLAVRWYRADAGPALGSG